MSASTLQKLVLPLLAGLLAGCGDPTPSSAPVVPERTATAEIATLQPREVEAQDVTAGRVIAAESVQVASRLMGYIKDIAVAEGQAVRVGQRLFSIDPLDIQGAVTQAQLGLKQAEDAMRDAQADYRRFESLHREEVVSRQQYEKMKLNYEIAVSRAAQAKAGLDTARGQMRYATVTSPINGVVTRKLANEGDIAAPGHPVLMVENPARLQVETAVSDAVFGSLKIGMPVQVEIDGQADPLTATVARLSPAADPMTHSYTVKLDLPSVGLRSGAFARVRFPVGRETVLAVPTQAVLDRAGITGVFMVDAQNRAQYRMVRVGRSLDGQVEILSGLVAGERVATGNASALNNGDLIRPATPSPKAQSGS